jgi:membrane-bound inhibitor of C-type lysozyme
MAKKQAKRISDKKIVSLILLGVLLVVAVVMTLAYYRSQPMKKVVDVANTFVFVCNNNKSISAVFYPSNDVKVDLMLSDGRKLSLPHAMSASGARYANDDESIVFWNKGETAFITENGKNTYDGCVTK